MSDEYPPYNLYEVLEIPRRASMSVVRAAYMQMARVNHPDANGGSAEAAERMVRVNRAYRVLSNPERRRAYNAHMRREHRRSVFREQREAVDEVYDPVYGYTQAAPPPPAEKRAAIHDGRPRCVHCGGTSLRIERRRKPREDGGPLPGQDRTKLRICRGCGKTTEFVEPPRAGLGGGLFDRPVRQ